MNLYEYHTVIQQTMEAMFGHIYELLKIIQM